MNQLSFADRLRASVAPGPEAASFAVDHLLLLRELRQTVADQDWSQASDLASSCSGRGHAAFQLLLDGLEGSAAVGRHVRHARSAYRDALRAVFDGPDRDEAVAAFRAASVSFPDDTDDRVRRLLSAFEAGEVDHIVDEFFPPSRLENSVPDRALAASVSLLSTGLQGRLQADFNRIYASAGADDTTPHARRLEGLKEESGRVANLLRKRQLSLYQAALARDSASTIQDASLALARTIEFTLPGFVRVQALIAKAQASGRSSAKVGRVTAAAGQLTREALSTHAAAYFLTAMCAKGSSGESLPRFVRAATEMQFDFSLPNGRDTTLRAVSETEDEQYIEIEGYVSKMEVARESGDGKLLSFLYLVDGSGQNETCAVAVFTHLPHRGVTVGSYCRLSGIYRKVSRLRRNHPAIEIDTLSLAEESNRSWRLALLRTGNPWFETWPNGLNLAWSLGAHQPTDPDDKQHLGAGEFLAQKPLPTLAGRR